MSNGWVQTKGAVLQVVYQIQMKIPVNKPEMLISHLIFIFWCQTQMFSVYSKNKGIGLTVPIPLEGSVSVAKFTLFI